MASFISRVFSNGRITIPKDIREQKEIGEGDYVEVAVIRKINKTEEA
jgi:AbrB family looped-hinge helix DNA binding protein